MSHVLEINHLIFCVKAMYSLGVQDMSPVQGVKVLGEAAGRWESEGGDL